MGIRHHNILPFSRDYRRVRKFDMGLPKARPPRRKRRSGWIAGGLALVLFGPAMVDAGNGLVKPAEGCRVWSVTDGDTVRMFCPGTGEQSARLLGFDTPEYKARCASEFIGAVRATYYLRWLLVSAGEISTQLQGHDRYGRSLTVLRVDGENVSDKMIGAGVARAYSGGLRAGWCSQGG